MFAVLFFPLFLFEKIRLQPILVCNEIVLVNCIPKTASLCAVT